MGLKIRAIDRSDLYNFMGFCARPTGAASRLGLWGVTSKRLKLWNFWFHLIVRATEAIDRSDFSNVGLYGILQDRPGWPVDLVNFESLKLWNFDLIWLSGQLRRSIALISQMQICGQIGCTGIAKVLPVDLGNDRGYRPGRLMFMVAGLAGPFFFFFFFFKLQQSIWSRKVVKKRP